MTISISRKFKRALIATCIAGATMSSNIVCAGDVFQMQAHPTEVSGTWELMNGKYERAITLLEIGYARSSVNPRDRGAVLTDLCYAYTTV